VIVSTIERSSPVPYYEQLYELLLTRIRRGDIANGDRLPGESELHREFGLSRATVRQALDLLESHGYAQKVPRRGYFAGQPQAHKGWLIEGGGGFLDGDIGHDSPRVSTTVLRNEMAPLPDDAAANLQVPAGTIGYVLERVRRIDGELALFSTNFTPPHVAPVVSEAAGVLDGTSSLTEALSGAGYVAVGARRVIDAQPANARIANLINVAPGSPLLRIRSTTWGSELIPYDFYETWLHTDIVPLEVNAISTRPTSA
jgi:GntR family transcriptional regulator